MNYSVVYSSMTGHSKKIARAVAEAVGITPEDIKNNPEIISTDVLIIVAGIYSGVISHAMKSFLEKLDSNQIQSAVLVLSSVTGDYTKAGIHEILDKKSIKIAGEITCTGSFLFMRIGHPNKKDIADICNQIKEYIID